jgi:hypothetical protein
VAAFADFQVIFSACRRRRRRGPQNLSSAGSAAPAGGPPWLPVGRRQQSHRLEVDRHASHEAASRTIDGIADETGEQKADHRRILLIGLKLAGSAGQECKMRTIASISLANIAAGSR